MAVKYVRNTENDIISFTEQNKGNIKINRPSNTHNCQPWNKKKLVVNYIGRTIVRLNKKKNEKKHRRNDKSNSASIFEIFRTPFAFLYAF